MFNEKWLNVDNNLELLKMSITLATDGGSINKSSQKSYSSFNINMNLYLNLVVKELLDLNQSIKITTNNGISFILQLRLINFIMDLVVCASVLDLNGHNGFYGWIARNWNEIKLNYGLLQNKLITNFKGIQKFTVLAGLPYFNWSTQISTDLLHNFCEGLGKKILNYIYENYKNNIYLINNNIKKLKIPSFFHRNLRGLDQLTYYKAIEYYITFRYAVIAYKDCISTLHYNIILRISKFLQNIMEIQINTLDNEKLLQKESFEILQQIKEHFGLYILILASHYFLHFANSMYNLGPLFITSCFALEDIIGIITRSVRGGKNNLERKAIELFTLNQLITFNKFRSTVYNVNKNDYYYLSDEVYFIIKLKKTKNSKQITVLRILNNEIITLNDLPNNLIPCIKYDELFIKVGFNDKFLL
ncbi:hypothetical protein ABK040_008107 [Willaertia magna]